MNGQINILFLGRRGSGRSSLANYLFDKQLFETGAGSPGGTLERPMGEASIPLEKTVVNIYDTPGLEPGKYEAWLRRIQEVAEESTSFDTDPSSWVHAAFYAVNAAAGDIDEVEIQAIKDMGSEFHFPCTIVLTSCDAADQETITRHRDFLNSRLPGVPVCQACSVEHVRRTGVQVQPFGRETALRDHAEKLSYFYERRATISYCEGMNYLYYHYFNAVKRKIYNSDLGLMSSRKDFNRVLADAFNLDDRELLIKKKTFNDIDRNIKSVERYLSDLCHSSVHFNDLDRSVWNNIDTEVEKFTRSTFTFNEKNAALRYVDRLNESFSKRYNDITNICLGEMYRD